MRQTISRAAQPVRAAAKAAIFFLKVFPMLPSQPVDWVTKAPVIEKITYPTCTGQAEGQVYRPPGAGPHPGMVVCLGVVPFGVDHPQVPVLGKALARAGFAALLYWSPAMRDFRLDPLDVENISLAYDWFVSQPYVDPARSGLLGTCVGGSFALMSAASRRIRDRIAFIAAYAPFSSMWTFARDIASASRSDGNGRAPWKVDPLTHKVFLHSLTESLAPGEAAWLRSAFENGNGQPGSLDLSEDGQAIYSLLASPDALGAEELLRSLPLAMQERLNALSPLNYLADIHSPLIVLLHDRGDQVIPVGESRRLVSATNGKARIHYTEMEFQHLDPVKGRLPFFTLVRQLGRFFRAVLPIFRQAI